MKNCTSLVFALFFATCVLASPVNDVAGNSAYIMAKPLTYLQKSDSSIFTRTYWNVHLKKAKKERRIKRKEIARYYNPVTILYKLVGF